MGIYKRGEVYWDKFMRHGRSVRESTKQAMTNWRGRWKPHTVRFWLRARQ